MQNTYLTKTCPKIKHTHLGYLIYLSLALDDPNWKLRVMEEIKALERSGTWEIVDLPRDKKIVGCEWVFNIKCKAMEEFRDTRQDL